MKKIFALTLALLCLLDMAAGERGINFRHDLKWQQALELAKEEGKLVFVDFYTPWCGPCYNMAQNVFTLPNVGYFYNTNFINMKIDCEDEEEGMELARKYNVKSYPTYGFIDPSTGELVHRSSSRQEPETFIATGESALNPAHRSFYLEEQYLNGNRAQQLLIDLIDYKASIYKSDEVSKLFDEIIAMGGTLSDPIIWTTFCRHIKGVTPHLQNVSDNYTFYCDKFGKEDVDAKLAKETQYGDTEKIKALCNFEGKQFNLKMIEINTMLRNKEYDKAAVEIDRLIADPATNRQELIDRLKYIARVTYKTDEMPEKWFEKCVGYLRFIAYNNADRDNANVHQEYADALERLILRKSANAAEILKEPAVGKTTYTMRPDALKPKPKRK